MMHTPRQRIHGAYINEHKFAYAYWHVCDFHMNFGHFISCA